MFLHLGGDVVVYKKDIVAILDIKSALNSKTSRGFLEKCEEKGFVNKVTDNKLRSFVVVGIVKNKTVSEVKIYYSPISALTLQKRANFIK